MCYMKSTRKFFIKEAVSIARDAISSLKEQRARKAESRFVVRMIKAKPVSAERLRTADELVVRSRKAKTAAFLEQYRAKA